MAPAASMHGAEADADAEPGVLPVPGTVHLVDLQGTMRAKHAGDAKNHDIVLVPAPSDDPDDPLNWSPRRKALSTFCMSVYTLMTGINSAIIYSVLEPISNDTNLTLSDLNAGTGYMFLFAGWGCLFWQPIALQYGKRPVYLFSILSGAAVQFWAPYTRSNGQWIANKILQGFLLAPIESLCETSITDIYFQHERGRYFGLYALLLAGGNYLAPVFGGFINDGQGWQWTLYWSAIFCLIGFFILFFFMEETNYRRSTTGTPPETPGIITTPAPEREEDPEKATMPTVHSREAPSEPSTARKRKNYLDKVKLWQKADLEKPNELLGMVRRPLIFATFPVIFFSGFTYGSNLIWFNVLNATTSLILGTNYGFKASMVGLSYLSPLIGVVIASFYTGPIGDVFVLWRARKNRGILEPEFRLWLFAPSLVVLPAGLILWGVGAAHSVHWFGLVFAAGAIACTNTVGITLSVAYAIDSYRALGGESIVTVILVRNTMSFAIGYGITPWVDGMGLEKCFTTAAFVGLAQCLTFLVMVKWGKGLRRESAGRYVHCVEEMAKSGMIH
ncbi:serine/threonine kinase 16 [Phyllosticta citriasiana]